MIIIHPIGGLANRMRVIASAMALSKLTNKRIKLIWIKNSDLNCEFLDLFNPVEELEIITSRTKFRYAKSTNQTKMYRRILVWIINNLIGINYCIKEKDVKEYIWEKKADIIKIIKEHNNIYFHTCLELTKFSYDLNLGKNLEYFSRFKPNDEVQQNINKITKLFNNNTIGIHIRRTDNQKSIEYSPTTLFIEKMMKEIDNNKNTNFFLATDDLATENELKRIFGNKIITYEKELNRNSKKGIVDAVVDLYCLSKTKYIYGSYWSSFSDIASRIGKIEFKTIKKSEILY
ncbi:hypothetical protein [Pontibacter vulgaris]|uniref:hypothetical protein n=1 Tax=Pontibacter vulgaris TaxID=2905679 RepID=UPI001FA7062B|nr:hypothetical protein [Pontibacter vulgaris]